MYREMLEKERSTYQMLTQCKWNWWFRK